jgi:hypothetical protein
VINPSYFIFPAWESFWQQRHNDIWLKLSKSSVALPTKPALKNADPATGFLSKMVVKSSLPIAGPPDSVMMLSVSRFI